jgi:peroxiredoxin
LGVINGSGQDKDSVSPCGSFFTGMNELNLLQCKELFSFKEQGSLMVTNNLKYALLQIKFYGDFDGKFHKLVGLNLDLTGALLGPRSQRCTYPPCFV